MVQFLSLFWSNSSLLTIVDGLSLSLTIPGTSNTSPFNGRDLLKEALRSAIPIGLLHLKLLLAGGEDLATGPTARGASDGRA